MSEAVNNAEVSVQAYYDPEEEEKEKALQAKRAFWGISILNTGIRNGTIIRDYMVDYIEWLPYIDVREIGAGSKAYTPDAVFILTESKEWRMM